MKEKNRADKNVMELLNGNKIKEYSIDAKTCLQKMKQIGVLSFATADEQNNPQVRSISAIHYEDDCLYFFTARGKNFNKELQNSGKIQVLGYNNKEMIRLSGMAVLAPEQERWINLIFAEQPYLANVYPGAARNIGIIYCIKDAEIEYFYLGVKPIFRETYTIGNGKCSPKGYYISEACTGCGICQDVCPQNCIQKGKPAVIMQEHCLHCGACCEACPVQAVKRRE